MFTDILFNIWMISIGFLIGSIYGAWGMRYEMRKWRYGDK